MPTRPLLPALLLLPLARPAAAAPGEAPEAALRRRGPAVEVELRPPAGAHANPAAPARLEVGPHALEGPPALGGGRLPLPAGPAPVRLTVGLCDDASGACWTSTLEGALPAGPPPRRLPLAPAPLSMLSSGPFPPFPEAPRGPPAAEAALAPRGAVTRLLVFSAVWCPPCNQLKAEVLADPADAARLGALRVEPVDVDRPESWALKSRCAVGGYPTVLAVDAAGEERGRLVGYPGEAGFFAWLEGLALAPPTATLRAGPPAGVDPAAAAAQALRFAQVGEEGPARAWLAAADPAHPAAAEVRLRLDRDPAAITALARDGAPGDWLLLALEVEPARFAELSPLLARLPPDLAAAALITRAEQLEPGPEAAALGLGARALLETLVAAPADLAGPHVTFLAEVRAGTGDRAGALSLLEAWAAASPGEFTYDHARAGLLLDAGRPAEAEAAARAALDRAYGDQRLRAVLPLARALRAQGRAPEAEAALRAELEGLPAPAAGVNVRTTRYRAAVEAALRGE
jgi:hypothetical protein